MSVTINIYLQRFVSRSLKEQPKHSLGHKKLGRYFTSNPKFRFRQNEIDNILPKIYHMTVKWPKTLDRPRKGDRFSIIISFEIPPCKVCEVPAAAPIETATQFTDTNTWSGNAVAEAKPSFVSFASLRPSQEATSLITVRILPAAG